MHAPAVLCDSKLLHEWDCLELSKESVYKSAKTQGRGYSTWLAAKVDLCALSW